MDIESKILQLEMKNAILHKLVTTLIEKNTYITCPDADDIEEIKNQIYELFKERYGAEKVRYPHFKLRSPESV